MRGSLALPSAISCSTSISRELRCGASFFASSSPLAKARFEQRLHAQACPSYPLDIPSDRKHVAEFARAIAFYGESIRATIRLSTQLEDANTTDMFTQVLRGADMNLWFGEAHEQEEH